MIGLSFSSLALLPASVAKPAYQPQQHGTGIVHLGIGAFHRAHQAVYTDSAIAAAGGDWRIIGASLRSPQVRDALVSQDYLYSVIERTAEVSSARVIGAVAKVLVASEQPRAIIDALACKSTAIVTMTVTEKGYAATAQIPDAAGNGVQASMPVTAIDYLIAGLGLRKDQGHGGITVISCDNLSGNGEVLRKLVLGVADKVDQSLVAWIDGNVCFPCTMVDRIVPATTSFDIKNVETQFAFPDQAPVICEPFSQWVIEDKFAGPRPAWEKAGALLVANAAPYEQLKLRLLNGSHSCLAYLGSLAGYEYIHEVISNDIFVRLLEKYMAEVTPGLVSRTQVDLPQYQADVISRFANSSIHYKTEQVAMDGSGKIPQRFIPAIIENISANRVIDIQTLSIAGWMAYVAGYHKSGVAPVLQDPIAEDLLAVREQYRHEPRLLAHHLLRTGSMFPSELRQNKYFADKLGSLVESLATRGPDRVIEAITH